MKKFLIVVLASIVFLSIFLYGAYSLSKSRSFQLFGELINRVETADSLVALTFDDGPTPEFTDEIMTILDSLNVKATFFVTGRETRENITYARKLVAAGHGLGNHSFSHSRMIFKSPGFIKTEVEETDRVIRAAGFTGEIYFRPPYCHKLIILPWYLAWTQKQTILWDIEPESYPEVAASADKIVRHVAERVQPGSIILLHVMYKSREESRKALPILITQLRDQGYEFVTVHNLLR